MTTNRYAPIPYKSLRAPSAAVTGLAVLVGTAAAGGMLLSLGAVPAGDEAPAAFPVARLAAALAQAGFWAGSLAVLLWWLASAYRNLPALGAEWPTFTPARAVAWWFVPVANLVRPLQAMIEVWRGSDPSRLRPEGYPMPDAQRTVPAVWWVTFVAGAAAVTVSVWAVLDLGPGPVQRFVTFVSHGVVLAASALTVWMVRRITHWQERRYRLLLGDAVLHHASCLDPTGWHPPVRPARVRLS